MKVFDSGMPDEAYWNSLFDIPLIVEWLNVKNVHGPIAEIGCGYGTFTVPVAKESRFDIHAFDIETNMIETAVRNVQKAEIRNVRFTIRDVIANGTGLETASMGMVLLFNILHFKERRILLEEGSRILKPNGVVAVIHWRKDIETPRGPDIQSRPDKEIILDSAPGLNLHFYGDSRILEPYHWGIQLIKTAKHSKETK